MKRFTPAMVSVSVVVFFSIVLLLPLLVTVVQKRQELSQFAAVLLSGPPPASGKQFTVLPPGATLPSSADCAGRVRRTTWEPRPQNTTKNQYVPVGSDFTMTQYNGTNGGIWLSDHPQRANTLQNRLDGNFTGTTDEILQWAACKWGVDEDMARAQAVVESSWDMSVVGDNGESFGILQVRTTSHGGAFPGAQKSTAFNADYTYMRWRICFEGLLDYLSQTNGSYAAGDPWGCMGAWYTGNWYGDGGGYGGGAQNYINIVKQRLQERIWESWVGTQVTSPASPTIIQTGTRANITVFLHGIGKGGDNVNPSAVGTTPIEVNRSFTIQIYNSSNQLAVTKQGLLTYNSSLGNFQGNVDIGPITSGVFTIKMGVPRYLTKTVPGIISITAGQAITVPSVALSAGDVNGDNVLSILDYNLILDCFSDFSPARNCSQAGKKQSTDLTNDGSVNQFDYNLFLRELSVQSGQ